MKKVVSLLAVLFLFAGLSFAATVSTTTYVGIADFSNSGTVDFSFTLKNVSGDAVASQLNWTSPDAFVGGSTVAWVRADQYAVVAATVTKAGFNVYMYQTNKNSSNYKAETPRHNADNSTVYSGLVNPEKKGGDFKGYIPVAFSFVGTKNANITYDIKTATVSATRSDKFFMDTADSTYTKDEGDYMKYTKIAGLVGPVFAQGTDGDWTGSDVVNNTAYMYFFGGFANITGGEKYGTDQLHIVQVTE
ncbi:hypothetical protein [Candidatus Ruminimicrobium bovinum]|uniref:hypothetical protein n=1 Tax=Candidatus Ruminimicrobium bovinum TaxID=3242779 RepID=UPI0039B8582E